MPVSLFDLAKQRRTVVIETVAGDLTVVYKPHVLTPADNARLSTTSGLESFRELIRQICQMFVEWDLVGPLEDEEGHEVVPAGAPVPLRPEALQYLSSQLLGDIFAAVMADRPKEKSSGKSSTKLFEGSFS